jgi:hypothetical protein
MNAPLWRGLDRRALLSAASGLVAFALPTVAAHAASQPAAIHAHWGGAGSGDLVAGWSLAAFQAIRLDNGYSDPLPASRILAMLHVAMHDAVNAAAPRFRAWTFTGRDLAADAGVAAATAGHAVLLALLPAQRAWLDAELARALADAGRGEGMERGRRLGAAAALAVLEARHGDGVERTLAHAEGMRPGAYRFVPGTRAVYRPHWRHLRPFALQSPAQFRVAPPPPLESEAYLRALAEVRDHGRQDSVLRSAGQTSIGHFWYEFSEVTWNRIARLVARKKGLDLPAAARLFALLNMALADAYVAGWDSKLHHDFWRPVTAIRLAGGDPGWSPLLPTPPVQDHPSTHSALGAAGAAVLADALGGDEVPFALATSSALPEDPVRRFPGFRAAALENAESRIMAGLHFRFACEAGLALGERVGAHVVATQLDALE